jgi:phage-related protein
VPTAEWWIAGGACIAAEQAEARVFFGFHDGILVAVHPMIKKTQKTPREDLALARQRFKELQSWQGKTRI